MELQFVCVVLGCLATGRSTYRFGLIPVPEAIKQDTVGEARLRYLLLECKWIPYLVGAMEALYANQTLSAHAHFRDLVLILLLGISAEKQFDPGN